MHVLSVKLTLDFERQRVVAMIRHETCTIHLQLHWRSCSRFHDHQTLCRVQLIQAEKQMKATPTSVDKIDQQVYVHDMEVYQHLKYNDKQIFF